MILFDIRWSIFVEIFCKVFDILIVTDHFKFFLVKTLFYRSILWNNWTIHVILDKREMCFIAKKIKMRALPFLKLALT